jgi:adenine deaminase
LQGGTVVYTGGKVLAELPLPIGGKISDLPLEELCRQSDKLQQRATELGAIPPNVHISLSALTTGAIPFFRICETGLMDIRKGEIVRLMVS